MTEKLHKIIVPRQATKYILFQRTQYLFFRRSIFMQNLKRFLPKSIAYPLESFFCHFNFIINIESFFTRNIVARLFSEEMNREYESMKPYLPQKVSAILDIGCGVAGIDALLYRHYLHQDPEMYLIDKTEMPNKIYYSYNEKGCYYNSLDISKNILTMNGVPPRKIFLEEARENKIGFNQRFDLVISLLSWGFHYPLSTYLDEVYEKMSSGGVLIIDVRKVPMNDPLVELTRKFGNAKILYESPKHARVAVVKMQVGSKV